MDDAPRAAYFHDEVETRFVISPVAKHEGPGDRACVRHAQRPVAGTFLYRAMPRTGPAGLPPARRARSCGPGRQGWTLPGFAYAPDGHPVVLDHVGFVGRR